MKKNLKFVIGTISLFVLAIIAGLFCGAGVLAVGVPLEGGGMIDKGDSSLSTNQPMADENFYTRTIDERICKIRPMVTPIDQISRHVARKVSANSLEIKYYSAGTQPIKTSLSEAVAKQTSGLSVAIKVADASMFTECDTMSVVGVKGYKDDGATEDSRDLMLYVTGTDANGNPIVTAINGLTNGKDVNCWVPAIAANAVLIRMGKACAEKDATAPTYSIVPTPKSNYCQNFMAQIEQSTFDKISTTEVPWNFSDKEEATLFDMKMGMELSHLFGVKGKIQHPVNKQFVWTCGGIYWEAGKDIIAGTYDATAKTAKITDKDLVDIHKELFTGAGAGSKRKILFAGSEFLAALQKATSDKYKLEQKTIDAWDLTFTSWKSNFGEALVIHEELFDMRGMSSCGFVLDPEFLAKGTFIPFGRNVLDLKKAGIKNSDAVVLQEVSCLYLVSPQSHARIKLATA